MSIRRVSVVLLAEDRSAAVARMAALLGATPRVEFRIPGSELEVAAFAGFSVLSGPARALASIRDLRATVFVTELPATEVALLRSGWKNEGTLGTSGSLLARDPEGNLFEFIEERAG